MNPLESIIEFLNARILLSGVIGKTYAIAVKGDRIKDKADYIVYTGAGQSQPVTNFDNWLRSSFWIMNGNPLFNPTDTTLNNRSCSDSYNIIYPLQLVAVVKKSELPCDNSFASDVLATTLIKSLSGKFKGSEIGQPQASFIVNNPKSYTDKFKNLVLPMEYALAVIDFSFSLTIPLSCFPELCPIPEP